MLRPKQMSKVSVTGANAVMGDVIEAVHDRNVWHLSDYDDSWEGFDAGSPVAGAESASEKLVTVRSLKSILGVTEEDAGPSRIVTEGAVDEQLEEVRQSVNELDDRRSEVEDELRAVEDRIDAAEPFVDLGIDLDLLRGYDRLTVAVGEADPEAVEEALAHTEGLRAYDVFAAEETVAVAAYPAESAPEDALDEALVGVDFARLEVPDAAGDPEEYVAELEHERQQLQSRLGSVESELEDARLEHAGFLLAAEETLAIQVQKAEAPLQFATTENAFVAEGWVPTETYGDFVESVRDAVGDRVEIEELERAAFDDYAGHDDHDEHGDEEHAAEAVAAADDADEEAPRAAADGGRVVGLGDSPPVIQHNSSLASPFELLVETINRPKYSELDPTVVLFLTFPVFFGFMIGDLGYGLLYLAAGWYIATNFDGDALQSLGGIAMWAGGFTALFGVLYGELFGLPILGDIVWGGSPPIHKGLQPHYLASAQAWLLLSVVVAVLHLVLARVFDFVNNLAAHGFAEAVLESGSWILLTVGLWLWVFSTMAEGPKPDFMFEVLSSGEAAALPLGYTGFSPAVGMAGLAVAVVGLVMVMYAEGVGFALIEGVTQAFGHVVSYTRLAAVLLAKAGMALAVNILVFGAELHDGEFHFLFIQGGIEHPNEVVFSGLFNGGVAAFVFGVVVLVLGHALVLALGVTSAGLQAVRLEYVEFFGKFYEGGGEKYEPFGYDRTYTTED